MRAYVINLDKAKDRWAHIEASFAAKGFTLCRVPAVDGSLLELPHPGYAENRYRWLHGRETNIFEVACYLSHVAAMAEFLKTGDDCAMICEDDIFPNPDVDEVVAAAMTSPRHWNILRLTGLTSARGVKRGVLVGNYQLTVELGRLKGAGAYLVDRKAAAALVPALVPMWLPYDHAFDREWFQGLTAAAVTPFPISQVEKQFRSSIQKHSKARLPALRRCFGTYPYQAFNEITRTIFRGLQILGLR